jgi:hypothetical protein
VLVPDGIEPGRSMVRLRRDDLASTKIGVLAATVITCYKSYEIPLPMDANMPAAGSAGLLQNQLNSPFSKITGCPKVVD